MTLIKAETLRPRRRFGAAELVSWQSRSLAGPAVWGAGILPLAPHAARIQPSGEFQRQA